MESVTFILSKSQQDFIATKCPTITSTMYLEHWHVERCLREGVPIYGEVVYYALLFHDAGYHEDHISKGFTSKEEYSAHLAVQCLRAEAIPEDTIKRVIAAILSTERDAQFNSNEEKAVRAADHAGLASDYTTFRSDVESCAKNPKC
jgi:hypothetical protein